MPAPGPYSIGSDQWNGLSKLIEECGEVLQIGGKLIGSGGDPKHFDGSDLRERLKEELADLGAAINFFGQHNFTDEERAQIMDRSRRKESLFELWNSECRGDT